MLPLVPQEAEKMLCSKNDVMSRSTHPVLDLTGVTTKFCFGFKNSINWNWSTTVTFMSTISAHKIKPYWHSHLDLLFARFCTVKTVKTEHWQLHWKDQWRMHTTMHWNWRQHRGSRWRQYRRHHPGARGTRSDPPSKSPPDGLLPSGFAERCVTGVSGNHHPLREKWS